MGNTAVNTSINTFINFIKFEKRYSKHTVTAYNDDLTQFFTFLRSTYGEVLLKEIAHLHIRTWLATLKDNDVSSRSINRKISSLKSFFKYFIKVGELEQTPMAKVINPKTSRRLPDFVKPEDAGKLIASLQNTESWRELNTKMLITFFYNTGMRLSELIGLKESQVDFGKKQVKVLGKGNKERIIPAGDQVLNAVKGYLQLKHKEFGRTEILLVTEKGKPMYAKYAYLLVNTFLNEELKTLSKKSPHILRHSFATHLVNNGANLNAIKELLGHSSLAATQVYTHNSIERLKDIHKKSHPKP